MAETATRPTRTRAARSTPAKVTPAKAAKAAPKAVEVEAEPEVEAYYVDLIQLDDTKSYAVFAPPADMKGVMVGKLYCPLGTTEVKVKISAPKA